ncbi:hypothetical protein D3Z52_02105 [Clostridiaceae bacterium]|jgi:hypothetical protein|nr:hypothetical protein [Clostridiaceae bacterium]
MNVAMIKHGNCGKVYWFEVPDHLADKVKPNARVACDTARGRKCGVVVGSVVNDADVRELMIASGATFPLRKIVGTTCDVAVDSIVIPDYMKRSRPSDDKIAKRFMEYYHTGKFSTNVVVADNNVLMDGYTAYLVAKVLKLPYLSGIKHLPKPLAENIPFA